MIERIANSPVSRRRFISIAAAACALSSKAAFAASKPVETYSWRGIALGAEAALILQHYDEAEANLAIAACIAEVERLEAIFSLYRPDSAISRLNRDGSIVDAPLDFAQLLSRALQIADLSNGAFDPTIQPLWNVYAAHFSTSGASAGGPPKERIDEARSKVSWRRVSVDGTRITLHASGMALTLNGIAQGYITDKVSELLAARGFDHVMVNMGEQRALGPKWGGDAWQIGIADPTNGERQILQVPITRGALATSGGYGCHFDDAGQFTHILDPRTGEVARQFASVTVLAPLASDADGLSTALSVMGPGAWKKLARAGISAFAVPPQSSKGYWLA